MSPNDENEKPDESIANGTAPSDVDQAYRVRLQKLREIATQMFFVMKEEYPWVDNTPDKWILGIMEELRPAANNIFDFDKFRSALLKAGAAIFIAVLEGDALFRANQTSKPVDLDDFTAR